MIVFPLYKNFSFLQEKVLDINILSSYADLENHLPVLVLFAISSSSNPQYKSMDPTFELDLTRFLLQYPSQTLFIEIWWREALSDKALSSSVEPIQADTQSFMTMNPVKKIEYVRSKLIFKNGISSHLKDIMIPDFLEDLTLLPIIRYLFAILCLTATKEDLIIMLKPILISSNASAYISYLLSLHPCLQEVVLPLIFIIMFDEMVLNATIYWKFRCLALDLSHDISYCRIIRDLLLEAEEFQELCVELSVSYLNDIMNIIDTQVPNNTSLDIDRHMLLSSLVRDTYGLMISDVSSKMLSVSMQLHQHNHDTCIIQCDVMKRSMKAMTIISHLQLIKYQVFIDKAIQTSAISIAQRVIINQLNDVHDNAQSQVLHMSIVYILIQLVIYHSSTSATTSSDTEESINEHWKILGELLKLRKLMTLTSSRCHDQFLCHDLIFDVVIWKNDTVGLRELCLMEVGLDRVQTILSTSLSGWQHVVMKCKSCIDSSRLNSDISSSSFISQFIKLPRPASISKDMESPCDYVTCIGFMLKTGIFNNYEDLHDIMLSLITSARYPPHSRMLPVIGQWIDVIVRKPSFENSWMSPILPLEASRLTLCYNNQANISKYNDIFPQASSHGTCQHCLGRKHGNTTHYTQQPHQLQQPQLTRSASFDATESSPLRNQSIDCIIDQLQQASSFLCLCSSSLPTSSTTSPTTLSSTTAWPGVLALYAAMKYIRQSRDVHQTINVLFEADTSFLPVRNIIQVLTLPHITANPDSRSTLKEILKLIQSILPSYLLPDRIPALSYNVMRLLAGNGNIADNDAMIDGEMSFEEKAKNGWDATLAPMFMKLPSKQLHDICNRLWLPQLIINPNTSSSSSEVSYQYINHILHIHPHPHQFELFLINRLLDSHPSNTPRLIPSYRILVQEPVIVLRLHISLLQSYHIIKLVLYILRGLVVIADANTIDICRVRKGRANKTKIRPKYPTRTDLEDQLDPVLYMMIQDVMICKLLMELWKKVVHNYDITPDHQKLIQHEIVEMMMFLRMKNKDLIRALIHFESFEDKEDWRLILSSSVLSQYTADIILSQLKRRAKKTNQFMDTMSYAMNYLRHVKLDDLDIDDTSYIAIQDHLISFLLDASPSHVTVFHSPAQNELIDSIVVELLDILVAHSPSKAYYLFKTVIRSTDGYSNKRYKDAFRAKYADQDVTNIEEFVAKILKDDSFLIAEDSIILMDDVIVERGDNMRMAGRKRSYSHSE